MIKTIAFNDQNEQIYDQNEQMWCDV